jgi:sRNA-binding carbon storage regulator CsrA
MARERDGHGLVLARRLDESIWIIFDGKEVKVTLDDLRGSKVGVLRIEAPPEVTILRDELRGERHGTKTCGFNKLQQKTPTL